MFSIVAPLAHRNLVGVLGTEACRKRIETPTRSRIPISDASHQDLARPSLLNSPELANDEMLDAILPQVSGTNCLGEIHEVGALLMLPVLFNTSLTIDSAFKGSPRTCHPAGARQDVSTSVADEIEGFVTMVAIWKVPLLLTPVDSLGAICLDSRVDGLDSFGVARIGVFFHLIEDPGSIFLLWRLSACVDKVVSKNGWLLHIGSVLLQNLLGLGMMASFGGQGDTSKGSMDARMSWAC